MDVFLAGATGAVGRRLLPMLVSAGHRVTGLTRSPEKAEMLRALGAEPAVADALDASAVMEAVARAHPEAVIHQLTSIPAALNPKKLAESFALTNRLRTEGTDHLLAAARAVGTRRFLAQSFGGYVWAPGAPRAVTEDWPRSGDPPGQLRGVIAAVDYLERAVPAAQGLDGIVLRYGGFYGPGTGIGEGGATLAQIRKRAFPVIGGGGAVWSFVHIEDAARATLLALDRGAPGIYNVADDEPAEVRDWLPFLAEAAGAPAPRRVPAWLGRLLAGETTVRLMTEMHGIVNHKAKAELGWTPAYPSWRQGFRHGLA